MPLVNFALSPPSMWIPTPSRTEVKERVELYLYSPSAFVAISRVNLNFTFTLNFISQVTHMNTGLKWYLCGERKVSAVRSYPKLPAVTHSYRQLPTSTNSYPQVPTITRIYPQVPTVTHKYPQLPTSTHGYPQIPAVTDKYPQLPTSTRSYPQIPTSTHSYPQVPTVTNKYPQFPTVTPTIRNAVKSLRHFHQ